jgi:hypothetical protein
LLYIIFGYKMRAAQSPGSIPAALSPLTVLLAEWFQFGFIFFATWILSRIEGRNVLDYGLQPSRQMPRWVATGSLWGLLFMSLLIAVLWSTHHLVFTATILSPTAALGYGLAWIAGYLGVGFFEEFFFRGYLQSVLTRCFAGLIRGIAPAGPRADVAGFWIAAVLISFGFGLVHHSNSGESPIGLLCAGLAGLIFAFSLWRTGSLWWAIGFHTLWDWAQSFLYGVADSGAVSQRHLLASHPAGPALLSGGLTGPEGSIFVLPFIAFITVVIALTLHRSGNGAPLPWIAPGLEGASSSACGGTLA